MSHAARARRVGRRARTPRVFGVALAWSSSVAALGCEEPSAGPAGPARPLEPQAVDRAPVAPTELASGRHVRRMTADQFHASLVVATGQAWPEFSTRAAALGRPDYSESLAEGRAISVSFEKLIGDAARATCKAAVTADAERTGDQRVILRHVDLEHVDEDARDENLRYLALRFLGAHIERCDDPRLGPYLHILETPLEGDALEPGAELRARWTAVCVALATHPDFFTY